jgi:FdhD protein
MNDRTKRLAVRSITADGETGAEDAVAVEEPLEIRLGYGLENAREQRAISITMRTPGHDRELAVGFLHGEGLIRARTDVDRVEPCGAPSPDGYINTVRVDLAENVAPDMARLARNFYTTSSCGVCGKSSLEALQSVAPPKITASWPAVDSELLPLLPTKLRVHQEIFETTGGLHAAALFSPYGDFIELREDVGRHNAVDKLIGAMLLRDLVPLREHVLLLSGRASFELMQKALMAGIGFVAAVGAPSSLAVDLARAHGITLVGFLRDNRFNVYTGEERVV